VNEEQFDCDFVRDLLPAYAGQSASAKTNAIVEGHIPDCPACREELEGLQESGARALQIGQDVLGKVKKKHSKKHRRTVLLSILLSIIGVIGIAALLFGVRVPVTLTSGDIELSNDYSWADGGDGIDAEWRGLSRGFHMEYRHKPWTPLMSEWSDVHYDNATGTQTEYTFYSITPRLVDCLLSPFTSKRNPRMTGYSRDVPMVRDENQQCQPKYPNVIWKVYYYNHRDEDVLKQVVFPEGLEGSRESLLNSDGSLKPEIAEIATLLWEGPVEVDLERQ